MCIDPPTHLYNMFAICYVSNTLHSMYMIHVCNM